MRAVVRSGVPLAWKVSLFHVDLVEYAAVGEVIFLRLGPAAKRIIDGEEFKLRECARVFRRRDRGTRTVEMTTGDVLAFLGIKIFEVGFRHRFGAFPLRHLV